VIEYLEETNVYRLEILSTQTMQETVDLYSQNPLVEYAEPNSLGEGGDFIPNDTFFPQQWHLNNTGQTGGTADADIDAVEGWQITRGSSAIVLAILDTGIDSDHPEFQGRILPGFDFVNEDSDPEADHPHGVLVSGISAANTDNNFAGSGVDHNVSILPVKVLDSQNLGTTFDLAQGLVFAANQRAHVINMSLINFPLASSTLNDALQFARDAGAILVACAGNGGIGNADQSGPGASPLTISVGATDDNDARASFSGTGQALDMVAPGLSVPTTVFNSSRDEVTLFSGCSAATPVVAGIATLLLSVEPSLTHDDIRNILTETAEDLVGPPSEDTPGRDDFFGFGRVNMHAALQSVVGLRPAQCQAALKGNAIDPDGEGKGVGAIIPTGTGRFQQKLEEGASAEFEVVNVALKCGTRLDVCLESGDETRSELLLQQIFLCDTDNLAVGHAKIDERNGTPTLTPQPDFETISLAEVTGNMDNICNAVVGRVIRVRRSESRSSPCNEDVVLEGTIVEEDGQSFFR
jgi:thermitase